MIITLLVIVSLAVWLGPKLDNGTDSFADYFKGLSQDRLSLESDWAIYSGDTKMSAIIDAELLRRKTVSGGNL